MKYLVDTNVFLRFIEVDSPEFEICDRALEMIRHSSDGACYCAQVMIELWAVATRPRTVNGLGMNPVDVDHELNDIRAVFECATEPPDMAQRWQRLAVAYGILGRQAHDARIVALMLAHGITHILTLNPSDFTRYSELVVVTPSEVVRNGRS